ncbi:S8 family serine peptidase [Aquabacterium sp. J223]|uniref:S8 family serine peptidase n=1 Tax=Aquabacterium sp. J223 TaxID=2898431 RepID=UPI00289E4585|nr:S8 family serine peptidase [Aquabacterium sp. J223]
MTSHRSPLRRLPALLTALLLAAAGSAGAQPAGEARVIVKFRDNAELTQRHVLSAATERAGTAAVAQVLAQRAQTLAQRHGLRLAGGRALDARTQVLQAEGLATADLLRRLAADPDVEYAVADQRRRALRVPNDPLFLSAPSPAVGQWYLRAPNATARSAINAVGAWDTSIGSPSVIVAVLDTGVRPDHPDLQGKLLPGYDLVHDVAVANDGDGADADASDPGDAVTQAESNNPASDFYECDTRSSWHGTMVSGLVAAATDNGVGMAGTGWRTRVQPVRVLGKCFGYDSDIIAGMRWAAGLAVPGLPVNPTPASVLNMSLGGSGSCSTPYVNAIAEIRQAGKVIVAAAGNSVGRAVGVPANCAGVVAVGGLRHSGTKVGFSDVGSQIAISAPGGNCVNETGACVYTLVTTDNTGATAPGSATYTDGFNFSVGTSFSSPLVAGTAALMLAVRPGLGPDTVLQILRQTARPFPTDGAESPSVTACQAPNGINQLECYCTTSTCGAGMLDSAAAVQSAAALGAPVTSPSNVPTVVATASSLTPAVGETVTLSAVGSQGGGGLPISGYRWTLVQGAALGQLSNTNEAVTTLQLTAGGTAVVRLSVTDSDGVVNATDVRLTVAGGSTGDGGGGALSWPWLAGLAGAVALLARRRRAS